MSTLVKTLLAGIAVTTAALSFAQSAPPNPASPNPATGAGQRSSQGTSMGTTGTPTGGGTMQGSTAGSTAGSSATDDDLLAVQSLARIGHYR